MPQYLAPGVYVEIQKGTPPIVPVGTSTPGFIGAVPDDVPMPDTPDSTQANPKKYTVAPVEVPQLLTTFDQFLTKFGNVQAKGTGNSNLAHAVFGFFNNGGSRCWVARVTDLTSANHVKAALKAFEPIEEISTVAAPGSQAVAVQTELLDHVETYTKYRFALLDGQKDPAQPLTPATVKGGNIRDSSSAALYFPWINVANLDLNPNLAEADKVITVPPIGHIAGVMARTDQQLGVHFSPANEIVRGALSLDHELGKRDQEGLNPSGINLIRTFRGGNIKIWGARTLGGDANGDFKYVSIQRTMNYIAQSIDEGTQFTVFKPNNQRLWAQIKRAVSDFLTNAWRDGALFGATPQQAFYVKVDEGNNPPEVRRLGQVIIEVGVAIVYPAEFVIFRITQLAQAAS